MSQGGLVVWPIQGDGYLSAFYGKSEWFRILEVYIRYCITLIRTNKIGTFQES